MPNTNQVAWALAAILAALLLGEPVGCLLASNGMKEGDSVFLVALLLLVGMAAALTAIAGLLFQQVWPASIETRRTAVKVPAPEQNIFRRTLIQAAALAHMGKVDEGYTHLLAARRRVLTLPVSDEPWVEELGHWYQQALNHYVSRHCTG